MFLPLGPLSAYIRGAYTYDRLGHMFLYYCTIPISDHASVVVDGCLISIIPCNLFGSGLIPSLVIT